MSTDNQPSMLAAQLRAQAASLLAYHQACCGFEHKLLRGMEREVPIRQFFSRHLANRFCVETGAIASADGMLDAQFDCLVTESHLTGTLFAGGSASIFPVEAVHVLLEVRSGAKLRLETAARQFQKVRSLRRTEGVIRHGHDPPRSGQTGQPVHTVVAYSGPTNSTTAAQQLESANSQYKNNGCRYPLDFVLVLSARKHGSLETGYLVGYQRTDPTRGTFLHYYPIAGEIGLSSAKELASGVDSFAVWFASIVNHLNGVFAYPPNLFEYLGQPYRIISSIDDEVQDGNPRRTR